jgi:Mn2+/Fe2+ NRAMP family transporter
LRARIARLLPTHPRRSEESQTFQQFPTPIPLAFAGSVAAAIRPDDVVLEPSAGTGLLAIPVLAGSTAYAVGEGRRWPVGLARKPKEAAAFYAVLALSAGFGIALNFTPINPISALYWSAVINGVLAVPVMVLLMFMARRHDVMGRYVITGPLYWLGWLSTVAMLLSVVAMGVGWLLGAV